MGAGIPLEIDGDRCQGHAICYLLAPELFDIDEDGRGLVIDPEVGPDGHGQAQVAADRCPERAIRLRTHSA
jgi:ferredoxin